MIHFDHLTKTFGRYTAVRDLSLEIAPHEAVALWGPNGAGKTTIIKCLLGLLRYQGRISVDGCDVHKDGRESRRRVGYVPQELAFYDDLSTLDTARFFARLKRVPIAQAPAVLEQVGLREHGDKAVSALSGGMKQRLALGLALLADPPALVMDEPTSNLDTAARNQLLALLAGVKAAGKTILFTSHRIEEVELLADRVVVMEQGEVQFFCPARELAGRLGLRSQVNPRMSGYLLESAVHVLLGEGFQARRNGVGVIVDVEYSEKARPIHALSRANIHVTDFEME